MAFVVLWYAPATTGDIPVHIGSTVLGDDIITTKMARVGVGNIFASAADSDPSYDRPDEHEMYEMARKSHGFYIREVS